jgi:2-oxoglutarate ferredoxin oxidoreductase subunit alpha
LHSLSAADFSIALSGSGGSGAITAGLILLEGSAKAGLYGLMSRSVGPQIRGGESVAMLRLSTAPVDCLGDCFDLLVGLDWRNVQRFADEIPLDAQSLIVTDEAAGEIPDSLMSSDAKILRLPFQQLLSGIEGGRSNMLALGAIGYIAGLPLECLIGATRMVLAKKDDRVANAAVACIEKGYGSIRQGKRLFDLSAQRKKKELWNISGNEASGLGALRGGVRFVAAYPITPASEMLEWLSPRLEQLGGSLLQAEDELASINMAIGASFGGVAAMTATSGPGLSLMTEGLGLAVASETPLTVVNVTRGGPSTGIPTKSEQSDLNLALYGMHGDAPHLVLAPISIADCANTTEWSVGLAERLQTVAIVLMDQSLGQARVITDPPEPANLNLQRTLDKSPSEAYLRYELTSDGVSPMVIPGMEACMYTAEGLEHNEKGTPSSMAFDHLAQLDKRQHKLAAFDYGRQWMESEGEGEICLLTWGSTAAAVFEAARRLRVLGLAVKVVAVRLLAPLQRDALKQSIDSAKRILVVEQNQQAQFFHYLHAQQVLPAAAESFARPGPTLFRPGEIVEKIQQAMT